MEYLESPGKFFAEKLREKNDPDLIPIAKFIERQTAFCKIMTEMYRSGNKFSHRMFWVLFLLGLLIGFTLGQKVGKV